MVKTLTSAFGIPAPLGEAMIRRFSLGAVEERLNALGYYWQPSARAWVQMRETGHILLKGAA